MIFDSIKATMKTCLILTFSLLSITNCQDLNQQNLTDLRYPEVSLISTEKRVLHSKIIDQDFEIYISLPYHYFMSDTTYPVLFSLDANVKFGLTSNVVNNLATLTREIPEIIVVGIAYPIIDIADWAALRKRDTTPTSDPEYDKQWADFLNNATGRDDIVVQSGGADNFLAFIRDELIPFIESNYRVSSTDRGLHGTSSGGLFILYTLFKYPELFQRYFAGSPSIKWDESYMYRLENDFAASHKDLPVRLFMCVGGLESDSYINNFNKMNQLLRSRNYPNLELETLIFENETHGTTGPASICRGLKILYKK
ncbi:MAG: alpha/beta hydrolase-fold protein [Ignavibacteriaceae bacterium]